MLPVYITIRNLKATTQLSQKGLGKLLLGFIFIIYERLEDENNIDKYLKAKIYYMALKTRLYPNYPSPSFIDFMKKKTLIML